MTSEEMLDILEEAFIPINRVVGGGFGRAHADQRKAVEAAPDWLKAWHKDNQWAVCFTQGVSGLLTMAGAFGYSKEEFLEILQSYYLGTN